MIRSIRQLDALRDEWDALSAAYRTPLLDHDWFLSCAEAFHGHEELCVTTIRDSGVLLGVAPLVREVSSAGGRVMQLGVSRLYEPSDWLCASHDSASALVARVLAQGRPLILQRLPSTSIVVAMMDAVPRHRAITLVRATAPALGVRTDGSWDTYYAGLSSQITGNLRRLRRKAETTFGPMRVERLVPAPAEVDALLESFIAIEGSGWKGRRGSDLGARTDLRAFFRAYGHRAASRGRLHVARLTFGGQLAAAELSVEAYGRMWQLKIGYHDAVRACYPGLHLTASSIQWAFERGLEAYEFLGSAAPWEERWRPEVREFRTVAAYPVTASGLTGACRDLAGALWRRMPGHRAAS
jgi:CelD/BcsL family acetyltransferase involved in cellulose biosynthesis